MSKNIKQYLNKHWICLFALLFILFNTFFFYITEQVNLSTSINVLIGWIIAIFLHNRNFQRNEIAKNKDKLTTLLELFFKELTELIAKKETTKDDIDDFISDKLAIIELKARQLKIVFKQDIQFISDPTLAILRDKPIDIFELSEYKAAKKELKLLANNVLNEVEITYSDWLKSN
ncbi:hypothetical protein ACNO7N_06420 [Bisgaard Taxon 45]